MSLSRQTHVAHHQTTGGLVHYSLPITNQSRLVSSQETRCNGLQSDYCSSHSTAMCATKQKNLFYNFTYKVSMFGKYEGHCWVIFQCFLSSMANIYNEKIFKEGKGMEDSIYIQNAKLYLFGVFFNLMSIMFIDNFWERTYRCGLFHGFNKFSSLLVFDNAFMGLTVSLMLKFRDNMFHVLSAQLLTVLVITLSVLLTGFQPSLDFFLQAPTVLLAIYIFNISRKQADSPSHRSRLQSQQSHVSTWVTITTILGFAQFKNQKHFWDLIEYCVIGCSEFWNSWNLKFWIPLNDVLAISKTFQLKKLNFIQKTLPNQKMDYIFHQKVPSRNFFVKNVCFSFWLQCMEIHIIFIYFLFK